MRIRSKQHANDGMKIGIVKDSGYLDHRTADGHPETHRRLEVIYAAIEAVRFDDRCRIITPRLASREEILLGHSKAYLDRIAATAQKDMTALTPDTQASAGSYRAARLAVGGVCEAVDRVTEKDVDAAIALVRPPGHHAEKNRALGYCLFNNVALGALYARRMLGMRRLLIVDWDLHHGNGTQHFFESDNSVLFFSIHQYPLFPGTGFNTEVGIGAGEGYTVNIPLKKGYGDAEYVTLMEMVLKPICFEFGPELILVSAGFDIHSDDPLGGMKVTPFGFAGLTRSILSMADECCGGQVVLVLEGGYCLDVLGQSVRAVIEELSGITRCPVAELTDRADSRKLTHVVNRCKRVHQHYWKCL